MAQNRHDDPSFFASYMQLPRQLLGHDGAPEWPSMRALIPDLAHKRVLDLGCGLGWFARWARAEGAGSVLAIDLSERMIAGARARADDALIEYRIGDLETLSLPGAAFDFAYSSLALHYVQDLRRLAGALHASLTPGSHFVFSIEHPIYMAAADPRWCVDKGGRKAWPVNGYSAEGERYTDWLGATVVKYHRTIATTLNTLMDAGFAVDRLCEFAPTAELVAANPLLAEEAERPMFLLASIAR